MRFSIVQMSCCWMLLMIAWSVRAQNPGQTLGPQYVGESPRAFVEGFYAWYVPRAQKEDTTEGWNKTLKLIKKDVSPQLAKLLEEDSAAQASCNELVGLDFDPFLYTQEPAEHYEVGKITQRGEHYRARIYRVDSGKRSDKPDVIAEFVRRHERWLFVNFYYRGGGDLLAVLKSRPPCSAPRVPE